MTLTLESLFYQLSACINGNILTIDIVTYYHIRLCIIITLDILVYSNIYILNDEYVNNLHITIFRKC